MRALGAVVEGDVSAIDDVLSPLAARSLDHNPSVRKALLQVGADWSIKLKDRSVFRRIVACIEIYSSFLLPSFLFSLFFIYIFFMIIK